MQGECGAGRRESGAPVCTCMSWRGVEMAAVPPARLGGAGVIGYGWRSLPSWAMEDGVSILQHMGSFDDL